MTKKKETKRKPGRKPGQQDVPTLRGVSLAENHYHATYGPAEGWAQLWLDQIAEHRNDPRFSELRNEAAILSKDSYKEFKCAITEATPAQQLLHGFFNDRFFNGKELADWIADHPMRAVFAGDADFFQQIANGMRMMEKDGIIKGHEPVRRALLDYVLREQSLSPKRQFTVIELHNQVSWPAGLKPDERVLRRLLVELNIPWSRGRGGRPRNPGKP